MKKLIILALVFFLFTNANAQRFNGTGGHIQDYGGEFYRQEFLCEVYGLPKKIDEIFGLEKASITIHHSRISDLKITLEAPDGSSIWLSNRNGRDTGKHYLNTTFSMSAKKYIHQSAAPFKGAFIPDGRMEYLNNGQDPNGYWKLIVEDLKPIYDGVLDSFTLIFGNEPAKLKIVKHCSLDEPSRCDKKNGELLPDLIILPSFTKDQVAEYAWNDTLYPGQLRFAATIANIGYGPMEINGTNKWYCDSVEVSGSIKCKDSNNSRQLVTQRIYSKQKNKFVFSDVAAGSMYLDTHPGHNHFHIDDWVEFRLVKKTTSEPIAITKGHKVSYCLFNSGMCSNNDNVCKIDEKRYGESMPNYGLGSYSGCETAKQGISVGGYDTYGMMYEGQFLQLPRGLKTGDYWLEIEIDPDHRYKESNKRNNTFRMNIKIQKQE